MVYSYKHFGADSLSRNVRKTYHYTLRNNREERSSHLLRGGSLILYMSFNEELNYLYSSPNIIRLSKSRILRWNGHVARMGDRRSAYVVLVEKLRERDRLEDPVVDGRIILKSSSRRGMGDHKLD